MSCSINSKDYCIVSSIYFISGQFAKLFCQVITKLLILCTRTGIQNKCQKNMGCISVQHKCCLHSMVAVTFLLLASLTSKCADTSDGTASALAIFVCLYQQNLFWYQQDPYIPTGAKLYLQNPKGTHTVRLTKFRYMLFLDQHVATLARDLWSIHLLNWYVVLFVNAFYSTQDFLYYFP